MSSTAAVGSHADSEASECCFTCAGACMGLSDHNLEFNCEPLLAIKGAASSVVQQVEAMFVSTR